MNYITETADGVILKLHIQPKASKSEVVGLHGDRLKVRLKAPPVDGKANEELVRFLSELLGVPKSNIEILSGLTGRQKTVKIIGVTKDKLGLLR